MDKIYSTSFMKKNSGLYKALEHNNLFVLTIENLNKKPKHVSLWIKKGWCIEVYDEDIWGKNTTFRKILDSIDISSIDQVINLCKD